jgi:hypothetical protein
MTPTSKASEFIGTALIIIIFRSERQYPINQSFSLPTNPDGIDNKFIQN